MLAGAISSTAYACPVPLAGNVKDVVVDGRDGVFVSREAFNCLGEDLNQAKLQVIALREAAGAKARSEERLQTFLKAEGEILLKSRKALEESRDAAQSSLVDSPVLWFAAGVAVTSLAVWGISEAVK